MALVAYPSSGANSYTSRADATSYLGDIYGSAPWTAAADAAKDQALVTVTAILERLNWAGARTSTSQDLQWPRTGVTDRDGTAISTSIIPTPVKRALWLGALELVAGRWDTSGRASAVTSISSGQGVSVTFSGSAQVGGAEYGLPLSVYGEISHLLAGAQGGVAVGAAYGTTDADGDDVVSEYIDPDKWNSTEPL